MTGKLGGRSARLGSMTLAILVAVMVFSVATAAFAQVAIDDETLIIDLGGKVYGENCDPCHANISETDNYASEIIFTHGYHQLIACSSCHSRFPHRAEGTERPTMQACFNCHGLQHGPMGELATGKCEDCHHTPKDKLRPSFHVFDWAEEPHVQPSLDNLQTQCMMCHDGAFCDDCHEDKYVRWEPPVTYTYDSDGGCNACHGDENLTKTSEGAPKSFQVVGVDDSAHRDLSCQSCHMDYEYEDLVAPTPIWQVNAGIACANCHADPNTWGSDADKAAHNAEMVDEYNTSIHAEQIADGNLESATCAGCHGGHYIKKLDTEFAKRELHGGAYRMCARCHLDEYNSYDDYYHGAAYKQGALDSPACWDCHGAHGILPSNDPESAMSDENKGETCGTEGCHNGSGESFTNAAADLIHQKKETAEDNVLRQWWLNLTSWMN